MHKFSLPKILFFTLIIAAFFFAIYPLLTQFYFYYDQARDAFEAYAIWNHDHIKIIGPATDIPGLYHGVAWYYLLAVIYALSNNNPQTVGIFMFPLLFVSSLFCYLLTKKITGDKNISAIATVLYIFSPLFQLTTRWLSNPSPVLVLTPLVLLFLFSYIKTKNVRALFLAGLCMGFIIQFELGFLFLLISIPLYFAFYRLRILSIFYFIAGFIIATSTFLLAEMQFKFRGVLSLLTYFQSSNHNLSFQSVLQKLSSFLHITFFPIPTSIVVLFLIIFFVFLFMAIKKKEKGLSFLLLWMVSLPIYLLMNSGFTNSFFLFLPYAMPGIIIFTIIAVKTIKNRAALYGLVAIIVILQINFNIQLIQEKKMPLTVQRGMTLQDEKKVIDYTYSQSGNKPFTINSLTSPLYINTTWAYLYQFYGLPKYNYLPYWDGRNQEGLLGNLPEKKHATKKRFFIIEPSEGINEFFIKEGLEGENGQSKITSEKQIGTFNIQERFLHSK